ncbi:DUF4190 domain-containing protein [Parasporobacterium paucivorans]|uniref:Zinc-ribbon domain-containing protein n=1 Tax=Parasporobacterium paucivorans DSM 15970 TaxID=1122934 RepID=A0A1M6BBU6_9FIRM|nr:DUF4190 domain-containing protein [Parasporobacterium paucivorans]SHI46192.1 zinc-ribbon domain-containing protein [Parasporobacterium paucivorans DSM 15970]
MKICPNCNTANVDTVNFCTQCGRPLGDVPVTPQKQHAAVGNDDNIFALASLILGIFSIITYWAAYFNVLSLLAGIVGILLGIKARNSILPGEKGRGLANAGFVCSVIGVIFCCIGVFTCTLCSVCSTYMH